MEPSGGEITKKLTNRKFTQRQILRIYQAGVNLRFLTCPRFPLVSQAYLPGQTAAVVEAAHQVIDGLPFGMHDDSR